MAAGVCVVAVLSACSSGSDAPSTLPIYTGSASPSPVTPAAQSPTARSPSGTASATPSKVQTFTIRRGVLPVGGTPDAVAVAEAWLTYWEYLAVADSIPAIDPATVGTVMTGAAATKAYAYAANLQKAKTHVKGTVGVDTTSVSVRGSTATLCGRLQMNAFEFNARGKPVESTVPTYLFFRGTAERAGPKWRVSDYVNLPKPC